MTRCRPHTPTRTPSLLRRTRNGILAVALGAGVLVAGTAVAGPSAGASGASLTLYSGQHVQTTQALVNAFEKKTGITVNVRFDDEDVMANQLVTEGTHSPADVFFTENSPPLQYLASKRLLVPIKKSTLAQTPSRFNSPNGLWAGVSARVSVIVYNPSLIKASQLPTSATQLAATAVEGQDRAGRRRDRLPAHRHLGGPHLWQCGRPQVARGAEEQRGEPPIPRQRDGCRRGQPGPGRMGVVNQYYWYRMRAEIGAANIHSAIAYFAPHDVGYVLDVSGAGVLRSSQHVAEAQQLVAFLTSAQGQKIIARSDSFEYPIASGVTTAQPETPFNQLQPNSITIAQLGTGAEAIKLLQEAQLL